MTRLKKIGTEVTFIHAEEETRSIYRKRPRKVIRLNHHLDDSLISPLSLSEISQDELIAWEPYAMA